MYPAIDDIINSINTIPIFVLLIDCCEVADSLHGHCDALRENVP